MEHDLDSDGADRLLADDPTRGSDSRRRPACGCTSVAERVFQQARTLYERRPEIEGEWSW